VTSIDSEVTDLSAEIKALEVRINAIQGQEDDARDQIKILIARIVALEQSSQSA
jgi:chaperonin cofactor prefoldin